ATRRALALLGPLFFTFAVLPAAKDRTKPAQIPEEKQIIHALNRFTFGIRPGDVERVRSMGLDKWFDEQLHPDKINDNALEARLSPLRTIRMSSREMVENFPPGQVLKAIESGRRSMPHDPAKRAIYESRLAAIEARQENGKGAASDGEEMKPAEKDNPPANLKLDVNDGEMTDTQRKDEEEAMHADLGAAKPKAQPGAEASVQPAKRPIDDSLLQLSPQDRYNKILSLNQDDLLDLARSYRGQRLFKLTDGMKPEQQ